jgi:hypothetical protein
VTCSALFVTAIITPPRLWSIIAEAAVGRTFQWAGQSQNLERFTGDQSPVKTWNQGSPCVPIPSSGLGERAHPSLMAVEHTLASHWTIPRPHAPLSRDGKPGIIAPLLPGARRCSRFWRFRSVGAVTWLSRPARQHAFLNAVKWLPSTGLKTLV